MDAQRAGAGAPQGRPARGPEALRERRGGLRRQLVRRPRESQLCTLSTHPRLQIVLEFGDVKPPANTVRLTVTVSHQTRVRLKVALRHHTKLHLSPCFFSVFHGVLVRNPISVLSQVAIAGTFAVGHNRAYASSRAQMVRTVQRICVGLLRGRAAVLPIPHGGWAKPNRKRSIAGTIWSNCMSVR